MVGIGLGYELQRHQSCEDVAFNGANSGISAHISNLVRSRRSCDQSSNLTTYTWRPEKPRPEYPTTKATSFLGLNLFSFSPSAPSSSGPTWSPFSLRILLLEILDQRRVLEPVSRLSVAIFVPPRLLSPLVFGAQCCSCQSEISWVRRRHCWSDRAECLGTAFWTGEARGASSAVGSAEGGAGAVTSETAAGPCWSDILEVA